MFILVCFRNEESMHYQLLEEEQTGMASRITQSFTLQTTPCHSHPDSVCPSPAGSTSSSDYDSDSRCTQVSQTSSVTSVGCMSPDCCIMVEEHITTPGVINIIKADMAANSPSPMSHISTRSHAVLSSNSAQLTNTTDFSQNSSNSLKGVVHNDVLGTHGVEATCSSSVTVDQQVEPVVMTPTQTFNIVTLPQVDGAAMSPTGSMLSSPSPLHLIDVNVTSPPITGPLMSPTGSVMSSPSHLIDVNVTSPPITGSLMSPTGSVMSSPPHLIDGCVTSPEVTGCVMSPRKCVNVSPPRTTASLRLDHTYIACKGSPPIRSTPATTKKINPTPNTPSIALIQAEEFDGANMADLTLDWLDEMGSTTVSDHDYSKPGENLERKKSTGVTRGMMFGPNDVDILEPENLIDPNLNAAGTVNNSLPLFASRNNFGIAAKNTTVNSNTTSDSILINLLEENKRNASSTTAYKTVNGQTKIAIRPAAKVMAAIPASSTKAASFSVCAFPTDIMFDSDECKQEFAMKFAENFAEQQMRQELLTHLAGESDLAQSVAQKEVSNSTVFNENKPTTSYSGTSYTTYRTTSDSENTNVPTPQPVKSSILEQFLTSNKPINPNKGSDKAFPEIQSQISQLNITSADDGNLLKQLLTGQIDDKKVHQIEQSVIKTRKRDDSGSQSENDMPMDLDEGPVFGLDLFGTCTDDMDNLLGPLSTDINVSMMMCFLLNV